MKKVILFVPCLLIASPNLARAEKGKLDVTFDLTYLSKWLSKGAEAYGQQGALFKTLDVDLYGTGFGVKVTHRNATSSGYVDNQRFDFRPYYKSQIFEGEPYATNYRVGWVYYNFPEFQSGEMGLQEGQAVFSWPNLLPIKGLCPS